MKYKMIFAIALAVTSSITCQQDVAMRIKELEEVRLTMSREISDLNKEIAEKDELVRSFEQQILFSANMILEKKITRLESEQGASLSEKERTHLRQEYGKSLLQFIKLLNETTGNWQEFDTDIAQFFDEDELDPLTKFKSTHFILLRGRVEYGLLRQLVYKSLVLTKELLKVHEEINSLYSQIN